VSGEATLDAKSSVKLLESRALPRTSLGEFTVLAQTPNWWGGDRCPSPLPTSTFGPDFRPFGPCTFPQRSSFPH